MHPPSRSPERRHRPCPRIEPRTCNGDARSRQGQRRSKRKSHCLQPVRQRHARPHRLRKVPFWKHQGPPALARATRPVPGLHQKLPEAVTDQSRSRQQAHRGATFSAPEPPDRHLYDRRLRSREMRALHQARLHQARLHQARLCEARLCQAHRVPTGSVLFRITLKSAIIHRNRTTGTAIHSAWCAYAIW